MTIEEKQILNEIAGFYEKPKEALDLLSKSKSVTSMGIAKLRRFRDAEKEVHEKRLRNKIPCSVELLKIALDTAPFFPALGGHSLGGAAYQAESFYQG